MGTNDNNGDQDKDAYTFAQVLRDELAIIDKSRRFRVHGKPPPDGAGATSKDAEGAGESAPKLELKNVLTQAREARLIGLALSGGGIRSATFNLGMLEALASLKLLRHVDYLSTVSGGGYIGSWLSVWYSRVATTQRPAAIRQIEGLLAADAGLDREDEAAAGCAAASRSADSVRGGDGTIPPADADRARPASARGAEDAAGSEPSDADLARGPEQVRFLRAYSNYLTPRDSFFSGDTWTSVSTYIRNSFLIGLLLIFTLASALLVPRWIPSLSRTLAQLGGGWAVLPVFLVFFLTVAMAAISANLARVDEGMKNPEADSTLKLMPRWLRRFLIGTKTGTAYPRYTELPLILLFVVAPVFLATWLATLGLGGKGAWAADAATPANLLTWSLGTGALYALLCAVGWTFAKTLVYNRSPDTTRDDLYQLLWAFVAGLVGGSLFFGIARSLAGWAYRPDGDYLAAVMWGPPALLLGAMVIATLHVGFTGRSLSSEVHEWWLRLGGWLSIASVSLIAVFGLVLYGPLAIYKVESAWVRSGLTLGWLVVSVGGALAAKSPQTGTQAMSPMLDRLAKAAPYVFAIGLALLLSLGLDVLLRGGWPDELQAGRASADFGWYWSSLGDALTGDYARMGWAFSVLMALFLSWRLDINLFSLHYFYRNRLVRCYLGASRAAGCDAGSRRIPEPFTGFDPNDDFYLADIRPELGGPYPIVNAALNLVSGEKLAWQQRKAASFSFTPHYCGYQVSDPDGEHDEDLSDRAYRRTRDYASGDGGTAPHKGIKVGTAMAVSGAAFSPNMGYHSSPPAAFLMTVFSVRLGLWIGNPRHKKGWRQGGPRMALFPLLAELFGLTNEHRRFCNLSDGGHFENLGIYELVRRRCRFIVSIDSGQDSGFGFEDLGNAIRKCRVDFGVNIDLTPPVLNPDPLTRRSRQHCLVGTIRYPDQTIGILVYIKPTLTGDEPGDVLNYAAEHPEFPHQTTLDQWFDESQFESYRALGYHIGLEVFRKAREQADKEGGSEDILDLTSFAAALRHLWYPPSPDVGQAFTRHAETLDRLMERLRTSSELAFMDGQIYPSWDLLTRSGLQGAAKRPGDDGLPGDFGLPADPEVRRQGFHFCDALLQLMESVYLDLKLEEEYDHPDNRGWMNLFHHWAGSDMLRATWSINAYTYGSRFQSFCERQLGLELGEIDFACHSFTKDQNLGAYFVDAAVPADEKLNFLEIELIGDVVQANPVTDFSIVVLIMRVPGAARGSKQLLSFPFGFALIYPDGSDRGEHRTLGYLRIQDHLRKTGLGSRALRRLMTVLRQPQPEDVPIAEKLRKVAGLSKVGELEFPKIMREIPERQATNNVRELFDLLNRIYPSR